MIQEYKFDVLTKLFAAGATPEAGAELRATEVRGALRWWFRVLGGVRGDGRPVAEQEREIFGGIADGRPRKSMLSVRVADVRLTPLRGDADQLKASQNSPLGYLLFPLRGVARGYFLPNTNARDAAFTLSLVWHGDAQGFAAIEALVTVFGCLGALGFRSRRCMGALAFHGEAPMPLRTALAAFADGDSALEIKELVRVSTNGGTEGTPVDAHSGDACTVALARWLKAWRSYGPANHRNEFGPGFAKAAVDHDAGLGQGRSSVRPAIGLPIIQRYSSARVVNTWEPVNGERFASPVLLRPYRSAQGGWKPLVIFVNARRWNEAERVEVGRRELAVSLALYDAMRADRQLADAVLV